MVSELRNPGSRAPVTGRLGAYILASSYGDAIEPAIRIFTWAWLTPPATPSGGHHDRG
jgi:hypothetical protein